ncbi:MAG: response regulator [Acidimicrobiales bacterium]|nr:response regulator [Acidimicrobiales bacterium]
MTVNEATQHTSGAPLARPIEILLVEDSPSDVAMTQAAFQEGHIANRIHVARDGVEAMAFLRREAGFLDALRPDLILLDLNLPRMDGREVLAALKSDPELRGIPVVILTTSSAERDVRSAYEHHANSFVTKPVGVDEFFAAVRGIEDFWLTVVRLPTEAS